MPLLVVLIVSIIIAAAVKYWGFVVVFTGLVIFGAALIRGSDGFQPCPKCGSRLTEQLHGKSPDASYGRAKMHPFVVRKCWRCRKTTMLAGLDYD